MSSVSKSAGAVPVHKSKAKAAQTAAKQRETVHTAPDGAGHTTTSTSTKES